MSEFLDELARSLTTSMPRRRAVRVLGGALLGLAVPATGARAGRVTHNCPAENAFLCQCPSINGLFYKVCCPNPTATTRYECFCIAPPGGAAVCRKVENCPKKCGKRCCNPETEYCAAPKRSMCCKKDEDACLVLGEAGSGQSGAGGRCCPRGAKCCANDKRSTCCAPSDKCCGGRCCPPAKECDPKTGTCRCPSNTKTCGRDCCKTGRNAEKCCDDHCCKSTQTCCGERCCEKGEQCCGGECCGTDEVCMSTTERVLQSRSSRSSPATVRRLCCPKKRVLTSTYCCPAGTIAGRTRITRTCCPPSNPHCCGELGCGPGERCISGSCVGR